MEATALSIAHHKIAIGQVWAERCRNTGNIIANMSKLIHKIETEIAFLKRLINLEGDLIKLDQVRNSNLTHLQAVAHAALTVPEVTAVLHSLQVQDPKQKSRTSKRLIIDIVGNNNNSFVKVIAGNRRRTAGLNDFEPRYGEKTLTDQAFVYILCAEQNPVFYRPPTIEFFFYGHGDISIELVDKLKSIGVIIRTFNIDDQLIRWTPAIKQPSLPADISRLNLDVSCMIAYVSALTNGRANFEFTDQILTDQAERERICPVKSKLDTWFQGSFELISCESAVNDYKNIINTVGGLRERSRADSLLERITVVSDWGNCSDDDQPSALIYQRLNRGKIKKRSLVVFVTGHALRAVTVTANKGSIRSAESQGVCFAVLVHDSRALTEAREKTAKKIKVKAMDIEGSGTESDFDFELIHDHCRDCVKILRCQYIRRPIAGDSCEIIACELECGARFHACKRSEHKLLCYNEKVVCINAGNGCPLWMLRRHLGRHLATCPASVVHCTMEWNRWPVCSRERQMHIPFHQPNPTAKAGQLDVALALRDQRMLNEWLRAPRKTRRALRNSLTRRFPAVPLQIRAGNHSTSAESPTPSQSIVGDMVTTNVGDNQQSYSSSSSQPSRTITDDEDDTPWESRKAPPGLQSSVCGELYRASKQATDSLAAALLMITTARSSRSESVESDKENLPVIVDSMTNGWVPEWTKPSIDDANPIVVEQMDIMESKLEYQMLGNRSDRMDLGGLDSLDSTSIDDIYESPGNYDVLFVDHTMVSEISSASMTDHARKIPAVVIPSTCIPPPPMSPPLFVNLGLDLTLESITRYQAKPKSMYTFLCAQEFRRDEYSWHYKNVHSDIHGGLNGWLEQRCPLAHYGCMYSVRRFFPTCCGSTIIHNNILESFGVRPYIPALYPPSETTSTSSIELPQVMLPSSRNSSTTRRSTPPPRNILQPSNRQMDIIHETCGIGVTDFDDDRNLILTRLPFEVLQHVARFLDSFSLCNLSMTNRLLREVCCSLLEERGIVVQQWERVQCGKQCSWRIAYKRWFFTTSFTPIRKWGFEEHENMASHLKSCIYFQRNFQTDPYFYPVGINPNTRVYCKLKAGIDDALRKEPRLPENSSSNTSTTVIDTTTAGDTTTKL